MALAAVALGGLLAVVGLITAGRDGVWAATLASGLCWAGAAQGFVLAALLPGQSLALARLMVGMLPRMGLPLGVGAFVCVQVPWLMAAGLAFYLIGGYLVLLLVETWLAVQTIAEPRRGAYRPRPRISVPTA